MHTRLCSGNLKGRRHLEDPCMKLTTHFHLVQRSKNAWSYTSTPHYVFMACLYIYINICSIVGVGAVMYSAHRTCGAGLNVRNTEHTFPELG
jgi:hypothetical protein